jgi:hypothetical protein
MSSIFTNVPPPPSCEPLLPPAPLLLLPAPLLLVPAPLLLLLLLEPAPLDDDEPPTGLPVLAGVLEHAAAQATAVPERIVSATEISFLDMSVHLSASQSSLAGEP